ncbi:hypothetical protein HanRHA438_Chr12g0554061 [Helianthus annuus]|nr:hypothetical protein HanRHA438_Chr12g0554061 [Helianthus annuus]
MCCCMGSTTSSEPTLRTKLLEASWWWWWCGGEEGVAGTGVFLPRGYGTNPPETRKRQACPIVNSPARMIESSTAPPQIQSSNYEMLMTRRKAMILGAQQQPRRLSNSHGGVMDNPEVLLPQEWTY